MKIGIKKVGDDYGIREHLEDAEVVVEIEDWQLDWIKHSFEEWFDVQSFLAEKYTRA